MGVLLSESPSNQDLTSGGLTTQKSHLKGGYYAQEKEFELEVLLNKSL